MQALNDILPDGEAKLQTASNQAEVVFPETASNGHPPIKEQLQMAVKQLEDLQQNAQMAQKSLQDGVDLQEQYENSCAELLDWIGQAEEELKNLEAPGDNFEQKQNKLDALKVNLNDIYH